MQLLLLSQFFCRCLKGLVGLLGGRFFEYQIPKTGCQIPLACDTAGHVMRAALPSHLGSFQLPNTAAAHIQYAQAAIKYIVNASPMQNYQVSTAGLRYPVSGIHQQTRQACQATGERVGDEKIAERRVATKASETSQSSPRVFSEIFCSTHPERGASQPSVQAPPKPGAIPTRWHTA